MTGFLGRAGPRKIVGAALLLGILVVATYGVLRAFPGASLSGPRSANALAAAQATQSATATPRGVSGCGKAPPIALGATGEETLLVGSLPRAYRLHLPASYQPNEPTPLVLGFHGHGSSPAAFERFTGLSRLSDARGFIAVFPQGEVGPDGFVGWNTSRDKDPKTDDLGFVRALLAELRGTLCLDPRRIYATGFSNGGGFTAVLACDLADRIAAFAPVAGDYYPQPGGCHPSRAVALLEIHGTADSIIPYAGSAWLGYPAVPTWLAAWAARDGCTRGPVNTPIEPGVTQETWGVCDPGGAVVHYQLIGGGHAWPVAAQATTTTPSATRTPTRGPTFDATAAIWAFFAEHTLPEPGASDAA